MMVNSVILGFILIFFLVLIQSYLSLTDLLEENQLTSLESGFESNMSSKLLSTSFFFLAILFVLFDMELILLFPSILYCSSVSFGNFFFLLSLIIVTLLLEWSLCGLKWQI